MSANPPHPRSRFHARPSDFLALVLLPALASAQALPPSAPASSPAAAEPAIELSPFVIAEKSDTGWIATETLAGSRLRTNFKDVPNQIETLTKDFMIDLGLNSLNDALQYTANVENDNDYVESNSGTAVANPERGGRVRGIGLGTLTRNYFQAFAPTDNYNIERATVASGPNAILFGLGSPSGILDATPARAQMRNRYGFELQYSSEDSKRASFDANVVVVPQKLALRLMGLTKTEYTEKKPNLDRDDRIYGTLTFAPFPHTRIILQGERSRRNWNRAPRTTPNDFVSPWFSADRIPGSVYSTPKPVYNNTTFAGLATNPIFAQDSARPIVIQGASGPPLNWGNSVVTRSPSTLPGVDPTFDAAVLDYSIRDRAIFPFDVNILGSSRTSLLGAYTKTVIVEQRLATNLFVELAYNREDAFSHSLAAGGVANVTNPRLYADANRFLPGTTTPNPYVGQLYFQGGAGNDRVYSEREDWRATASYESDLGRAFAARGAWGRWLGRHRWSALYTAGTNTYLRQSFARRILDDPVIAGLALRAKTFRNWAVHATRVPNFRHYFGDPYEPTFAAGSMLGDWSPTDANGRSFTLYGEDTPLRSASGKRLGGNTAINSIRNKADALIFAWQGHFLRDRTGMDRLVLTYGYRKDSARSANLDADSLTQDFSGLYPVLWDARFEAFGPTQSGTNRSLGAVGRPLSWLTVFYNQSTTFDLNIGRFDPFGNELPGAAGDGKDYGVRLDLWTDKISLRLNRYENTLGPQRDIQQTIGLFRDVFYNIEARVLELNPATPTINVVDGNRRGFRTMGRNNYFIMADWESTGYELELNMTPVRNWNIRVNGARSEVRESNIGQAWFAWHDARLPVWQAVVARNGEVDAAGRPVTWSTAPYSVTQSSGQTLAQYYNSEMVRALGFMQAAEGRVTDTARSARGNLITNYRFGEGRLKGFSMGGAVRWRAAPTIGYGVKTTANGDRVMDLDRVYKGKAETYVDFLAAYRARMKAFGGFNYRVQLNVRNLLDADDPLPVTAISTGAITRIATVDGRLIQMTFAVDF